MGHLSEYKPHVDYVISLKHLRGFYTQTNLWLGDNLGQNGGCPGLTGVHFELGESRWPRDAASASHSRVIKPSQLDGLEVLFFDSFETLQPIKNISLPGPGWLRCVCFFTSALAHYRDLCCEMMVVVFTLSAHRDGAQLLRKQKLESISVSRYLRRVTCKVWFGGGFTKISAMKVLQWLCPQVSYLLVNDETFEGLILIRVKPITNSKNNGKRLAKSLQELKKYGYINLDFWDFK